MTKKAEKTEINEIVSQVRKNREDLLKKANGDVSLLDKNGKALANRYGLKLSKLLPLPLKAFQEVS